LQATELERRLKERNSQKGAAERFLEEKELVNSQLRTQTMDMADEIALLRSTLTDVRQVQEGDTKIIIIINMLMPVNCIILRI
jgi:uncharacterized protein YaaN involved in tellurite resistance